MWLLLSRFFVAVAGAFGLSRLFRARAEARELARVEEPAPSLLQFAPVDPLPMPTTDLPQGYAFSIEGKCVHLLNPRSTSLTYCGLSVPDGWTLTRHKPNRTAHDSICKNCLAAKSRAERRGEV